ncbi:unnamed protein product [Amoebophrya sp. A120]|nr:unnamed protein product [Amoebophrya sp. A120]|eukprot:GSA120T00008429001.1
MARRVKMQNKNFLQEHLQTSTPILYPVFPHINVFIVPDHFASLHDAIEAVPFDEPFARILVRTDQELRQTLVVNKHVLIDGWRLGGPVKVTIRRNRNYKCARWRPKQSDRAARRNFNTNKEVCHARHKEHKLARIFSPPLLRVEVGGERAWFKNLCFSVVEDESVLSETIRESDGAAAEQSCRTARLREKTKSPKLFYKSPMVEICCGHPGLDPDQFGRVTEQVAKGHQQVQNTHADKSPPSPPFKRDELVGPFFTQCRFQRERDVNDMANKTSKRRLRSKAGVVTVGTSPASGSADDEEVKPPKSEIRCCTATGAAGVKNNGEAEQAARPDANKFRRKGPTEQEGDEVPVTQDDAASDTELQFSTMLRIPDSEEEASCFSSGAVSDSTTSCSPPSGSGSDSAGKRESSGRSGSNLGMRMKNENSCQVTAANPKQDFCLPNKKNPSKKGRKTCSLRERYKNRVRKAAMTGNFPGLLMKPKTERSASLERAQNKRDAVEFFAEDYNKHEGTNACLRPTSAIREVRGDGMIGTPAARRPFPCSPQSAANHLSPWWDPAEARIYLGETAHLHPLTEILKIRDRLVKLREKWNQLVCDSFWWKTKDRADSEKLERKQKMKNKNPTLFSSRCGTTRHTNFMMRKKRREKPILCLTQQQPGVRARLKRNKLQNTYQRLSSVFFEESVGAPRSTTSFAAVDYYNLVLEEADRIATKVALLDLKLRSVDVVGFYRREVLALAKNQNETAKNDVDQDLEQLQADGTTCNAALLSSIKLRVEKRRKRLQKRIKIWQAEMKAHHSEIILMKEQKEEQDKSTARQLVPAEPANKAQNRSVIIEAEFSPPLSLKGRPPSSGENDSDNSASIGSSGNQLCADREDVGSASPRLQIRAAKTTAHSATCFTPRTLKGRVEKNSPQERLHHQVELPADPREFHDSLLAETQGFDILIGPQRKFVKISDNEEFADFLQVLSIDDEFENEGQGQVLEGEQVVRCHNDMNDEQKQRISAFDQPRTTVRIKADSGRSRPVVFEDACSTPELKREVVLFPGDCLLLADNSTAIESLPRSRRTKGAVSKHRNCAASSAVVAFLRACKYGQYCGGKGRVVERSRQPQDSDPISDDVEGPPQLVDFEALFPLFFTFRSRQTAASTSVPQFYHCGFFNVGIALNPEKLVPVDINSNTVLSSPPPTLETRFHYCRFESSTILATETAYHPTLQVKNSEFFENGLLRGGATAGNGNEMTQSRISTPTSSAAAVSRSSYLSAENDTENEENDAPGHASTNKRTTARGKGSRRLPQAQRGGLALIANYSSTGRFRIQDCKFPVLRRTTWEGLEDEDNGQMNESAAAEEQVTGGANNSAAWEQPGAVMHRAAEPPKKNLTNCKDYHRTTNSSERRMITFEDLRRANSAAANFESQTSAAHVEVEMVSSVVAAENNKEAANNNKSPARPAQGTTCAKIRKTTDNFSSLDFFQELEQGDSRKGSEEIIIPGAASSASPGSTTMRSKWIISGFRRWNCERLPTDEYSLTDAREPRVNAGGKRCFEFIELS